MRTSFAFFSLQGLGNSILNFPILNILRQSRDVQVISYHNGSSDFFKSFHEKVTEIRRPVELLCTAYQTRAPESFVTYPTWRRELSSSLLVHADQKFIMRPLRSACGWKGFWRYSADARMDRHDLENNIELMKMVPGTPQENFDLHLNVRSALGLNNNSQNFKSRILAIHPTASTETKFYPLQFWTSLLRSLKSEFGKILLFCGKKQVELDFCQSIVDQLKHDGFELEICSNLPFDQVVKLIDSADHFIGHDSALMHLSALIDKATVGLWSFANFRVIYPYGNHVQVYLPKETLTAKSHDYPAERPSYLDRASASDVADIINLKKKPAFEISPLYKNAVSFYEF